MPVGVHRPITTFSIPHIVCYVLLLSIANCNYIFPILQNSRLFCARFSSSNQTEDTPRSCESGLASACNSCLEEATVLVHQRTTRKEKVAEYLC